MQPQPSKNATKRKLTISHKYFPRKKESHAIFPAIRLSGKWLLQAGFCAGQVIDVACEQDRLVITLIKKQGRK